MLSVLNRRAVRKCLRTCATCAHLRNCAKRLPKGFWVGPSLALVGSMEDAMTHPKLPSIPEHILKNYVLNLHPVLREPLVLPKPQTRPISKVNTVRKLAMRIY